MQQRSPRGRSSWPSGDDYTLFSLVVVAGGIAISGWLAWTNHHAEISRGFARLAHWHIAAIRSFTDEYNSLDRQLISADYSRVTLKGIGAAAASIGAFFRAPAAALLVALAVVCFVRATSSRFTRRLDLDGLIAEQAGSFRTIAAFASRKLRLTQLGAGDPRPADPALHPAEWLDRHGERRGGSYDPNAIRAELVRQLGPPWTGARHSAPHVRVLFVAFALHLAQQRTEALALLGDMAEALRPVGREPDTGPVAPICLPACIMAKADATMGNALCVQAANIACGHAFTTTALMSLLTEARRHSGVLAPAAFNGLKLVDRRLWYALHSLGFPNDGHGRTYHPNPCAEAIGARDHWAVEVELGRKMPTPAVDRAIAAMCAIGLRHASGQVPGRVAAT
jgi:intracellular multiplication protein IcmP